MFNVNDNQDKVFSKEKKETKTSNNESSEFNGFSQNQNEVIANNVKPSKKDHISFNEFEEVQDASVEKTKGEQKKFEEYFEQGRAEQSELEIKEKPKKKQKKPKKLRRKKQRDIEDFEDVKKRRAYKYKRKKYTKVVDFIKFLNENYLDLDEIADKVLGDENFHGWLKKRSKQFDESIEEFKDIIETIGN